jgi:2-keto-myo-inositol isomerase
MKLGFHGATTMTSELETDVAISSYAGFKALELWAAKVDRFLVDRSLQDLKALLEDSRVAPITLNSIEFISFRSDEEYMQIRARCRELSEIAQAIDCPTLIVVPSPTPERDMSWADIVEEHVRVLRDLSDIAGEYGVRLAFEFLGFGWCSVRTPRGAWEIVAETDRDNVGLVLDAAHFYAGGGLLSEIELLDADHIFASATLFMNKCKVLVQEQLRVIVAVLRLIPIPECYVIYEQVQSKLKSCRTVITYG